MNNILVSQKKIKLSNTSVNMQIETEVLEILVKGNVIINEIVSKNDSLKLNICLDDNSNLEYNRFGILNNFNLEITIVQNNNSNLKFNDSFIAHGIVNMQIHTKINGNSNICHNIFRGVSVGDGNIRIEETGEVLSKTRDNNLTMDIRCLTLGENPVTIIPNMLISTEEVIANHFVAMGSVNDEDLFYLNSKGISNEKGILLIKNGFLINNLFNHNNLIKIKEILIEGGKIDES